MMTQSAPPLLTLASASPRRRELLSLAGWSFDLQPAAVEEIPGPGESAEAMAARLAVAKARAAARNPGGLTLGADTVVEHRGGFWGSRDAQGAGDARTHLGEATG
jgi:septum formation protein